MDQPLPLLSLIFGLFKQTSLQCFKQIYVKKFPPSIQCRDLNPQPLERESPPITTRRGASPIKILEHKFYATLFFQAF